MSRNKSMATNKRIPVVQAQRKRREKQGKIEEWSTAVSVEKEYT